MGKAREFDIIVYGASGYTGRLVADYLARTAPDGTSWAMAGRNEAKLAEVRDEIGAPADTPLVIADADQPATVDAMAERAKVVLTTVGPYQLYGEPLVAACASAGTDYVDLCGEPAWMRQMIDKYHDAAKASGARIVFSCGFDSIPFDCGVWFVQQIAAQEFGAPAPRVRGRVRAMEGKFSGGTAASLKATMAAAARDPEIIKLLVNPFSLTPGFTGADQPRGDDISLEDDIGSWTAPFIMAAINTRNVLRSNFLLGQVWGDDFAYDEKLMTGPGDAGEATAKGIASANPFGGDDAPKPGEGPTREERENGHYDVLFIAENGEGGAVRASVNGDMDPGYGSTSKMISETALCLIEDVPDSDGGIWTPAALMAAPLIARLEGRAGLSFSRED